MVKLAAAGNVEAPANLVLVAKGYCVVRRDGESEEWRADKEGVQLVGGSPLELLGLACLLDVRGAAWRASDAEIAAFLEQFHP